ncbi:MAG TPA: DUF424 family protein [Candidatus Bathyarchaeia archaeon]|nr:DUF424 family protein [Candidatus Bathyarchaeia archaeon]
MTKDQMFYLRARRTEKEYLVSVCDAELLGKTLCEGELELYVSERFFSGELVNLEKCLEEMWNASSLNLIGTAIVTAAIKERMINELSVMWINCPENGRTGHAMLIR